MVALPRFAPQRVSGFFFQKCNREYTNNIVIYHVRQTGGPEGGDKGAGLSNMNNKNSNANVLCDQSNLKHARA